MILGKALDLLGSVWCTIRRHPLEYDCPQADEEGFTVMVSHCWCCAILEKEYV